MQLPWRRSFEEQLFSVIGREFERYGQRCRELHEDFLRRVRLREEARKELAAAKAEVQKLQGRGVSLLGETNTAMLDEDEGALKRVKSRHDLLSRKLDRAQSRKEEAATRLAGVEFDEREAARELMQAGHNQLEEARAHAAELRNFLDELLDAQQQEISEAAKLLTEEHEARSERDDPEEG